jgi:hypothetical protein
MDELTRSIKSFSEQAADSIGGTLAGLSVRAVAAPRPPRPPSDRGAPSPPPPPPPGDDARRGEAAAAARAAGEAALAALDAAYFSSGGDPLRAELGDLADGAKQGDVDGVVERLTAALEVRVPGHHARRPRPRSARAGLRRPGPACGRMRPTCAPRHAPRPTPLYARVRAGRRSSAPASRRTS